MCHVLAGKHSEREITIGDENAGHFSVTCANAKPDLGRNHNPVQTRSIELLRVGERDITACYTNCPRKLPIELAQTTLNLSQNIEGKIPKIKEGKLENNGGTLKAENKTETPKLEPQLRNSLIVPLTNTTDTIKADTSVEFIKYVCKSDGACTFRGGLFIKSKNPYWLSQASTSNILAELKSRQYDQKIKEAIRAGIAQLTSMGMFTDVLAQSELPEIIYRVCIESKDFTLYSFHGIQASFSAAKIKHTLNEENLALIMLYPIFKTNL